MYRHIMMEPPTTPLENHRLSARDALARHRLGFFPPHHTIRRQLQKLRGDPGPLHWMPSSDTFTGGGT